MSARRPGLSGLVARAFATLVLSLAVAGPARATVLVTALEVGGDVVLTGSGSLDLTGTVLFNTVAPSGYLAPNTAQLILSGGSPMGQYIVAGLASPGPFGTGGGVLASSASGDAFGIANYVFAPSGYVSGSPLSGSATWAGQSFASLGLNPGTYTWTWPADSFVLVVPEPALAALAAAALLGLGLRSRRR